MMVIPIERAYFQERNACFEGKILSVLAILTLMGPALYGQRQGKAGQEILMHAEPELARLWNQKEFAKAATFPACPTNRF